MLRGLVRGALLVMGYVFILAGRRAAKRQVEPRGPLGVCEGHTATAPASRLIRLGPEPTAVAVAPLHDSLSLLGLGSKSLAPLLCILSPLALSSMSWASLRSPTA